MGKENTKSVLEEAVLELKTILEAADNNAKNNLAKELPEKFESLLSEEIKKIKNNKESVNESAKDEKKEPQHEGKKEDTDNKEESLNEMEEMDMREMSIEEVEDAYDQAIDDDMFETIDVDDIAAEIDEMEGIQEEIDDMENTNDNPNDPHAKLKHLYEMMSEMIKEMDEAKIHEELHEKFDSHMKDMYGESYKDMMGDDKCNELYEMFKETKSSISEDSINESEEMNEKKHINEAVDPAVIQSIGGALGVLAASGGIAALQKYLTQKFPKAAEALAQTGAAASSGIKGGTTSMGGMTEEMGVEDKSCGDEIHNDVSDEQIDEAVDPAVLQSVGGALGVLAASGGIAALQSYLSQKFPKVADALAQAGAAASGGIKGGSTSITEEDDDDCKCKEEVDETAGSAKMHSLNRTVGNENLPKSQPRKQSTQREYQTQQVSEGQTKKFEALIAENKKLTKKVNDFTSEKLELSNTNESYKGVLEKYRNQLQEMAVLNTNIAHVNNLLIKENNLSVDEKREIINKFKNVESISEADNIYKSLLSEMVDKKEILDEGIEEKLNDSIDPSSSKIVTEQVVEKTAYSNDHLKKIKSIMNYSLKK